MSLDVLVLSVIINLSFGEVCFTKVCSLQLAAHNCGQQVWIHLKQQGFTF